MSLALPPYQSTQISVRGRMGALIDFPEHDYCWMFLLGKSFWLRREYIKSERFGGWLLELMEIQ